MKLHIEVVPNPFNESGFVLILYRPFLWIFRTEIGRVISIQQLKAFIEAHEELSGEYPK